jgi:hypothetical protein
VKLARFLSAWIPGGIEIAPRITAEGKDENLVQNAPDIWLDKRWIPMYNKEK